MAKTRRLPALIEVLVDDKAGFVPVEEVLNDLELQKKVIDDRPAVKRLLRELRTAERVEQAERRKVFREFQEKRKAKK